MRSVKYDARVSNPRASIGWPAMRRTGRPASVVAGRRTSYTRSTSGVSSVLVSGVMQGSSRSPARGPLDEVLGELTAAPVGVETDHEAVLVDLHDRPTRGVPVGRAPGGHHRVAVDGGCSLAEPGGHHGLATDHRLVVGVVPVGDVGAEQVGDLLTLVGTPGRHVAVEPGLGTLPVHRATVARSAAPGVRRGRGDLDEAGSLEDRPGE